MTELSPAAQAILKAAYKATQNPKWQTNFYASYAAAALRAAADHIDHDWSGFNCVDALCEIAAELEAQ
jgi:hypothetical protein